MRAISSSKKRRLVGSIKKNIEWLMFLRVLVFSVMLGVLVISRYYFHYAGKGIDPNYQLRYIYFIIGFTYFLTAVYIYLLRIVKKLKAFAYTQLLLDVIIITALVYITGDKDSVFTFMYPLIIISASIILYRPGGFLCASLSGILYGIMVELQFYGILKPETLFNQGIISQGSLHNEGFVFYNIFTNIAAFFIVAFLSGYLAEQLKRTGLELIEKQIDYEELKLLNNEIIQNIGTGLITINTQEQIISINRQAERIVENRLEDMYMRPLEDFIPGLISNIEKIEDGHTKGRLNRWEKKFVSADDKKYTLGFSVFPLQNAQGETTGKIVLFQDITHIREMEIEIKKSDRLATLGKLAANLAHEIRNPLASMSGSIQMLKSEISLDGKNKDLMDIVLQEIGRLNHLITDFLMYARPAEMNRSKVDLKDIIHETITVFRHTPKGGNRIDIETSFSGDTTIEGDIMQLKQIFWNIFINSAEAISANGIEQSKEGVGETGGKISVTTEKTNQNGNEKLVVTVSDNGKGLDEETRMSAFDPFFSTKEGGTGLGLSTVKQIVEAHGGTIDIKEEIDRGTRIVITFPS